VRECMVSGADLFPTVLAAATREAPANPIDGICLWPLMENEAAPHAHEILCWHYPHYHHLGIAPCGAIRAGDFKLIEWFGPQPRYELFNLADDPGESRDLAASDRVRRDELARRLREWRVAVGAQEMEPDPAYDPAAPTRLLPPASDAAPT
jgi:arylsulfatase A